MEYPWRILQRCVDVGISNALVCAVGVVAPLAADKGLRNTTGTDYIVSKVRPVKTKKKKINNSKSKKPQTIKKKTHTHLRRALSREHGKFTSMIEIEKKKNGYRYARSVIARSKTKWTGPDGRDGYLYRGRGNGTGPPAAADDPIVCEWERT